jgi:hypothetical protein
MVHGPPELRGRLLGRVARALLPWACVPNNSLRAFALLTLDLLMGSLGLPAAPCGGGGAGAGDAGGGAAAAEALWEAQMGAGGVAVLWQARALAAPRGVATARARGRSCSCPDGCPAGVPRQTPSP